MKEFFVIHFNCDCGSNTLILSAQEWKPNVKGWHHCRFCYKQLGDMDYNVLLNFKAKSHLSAYDVWIEHKKSLRLAKQNGEKWI